MKALYVKMDKTYSVLDVSIGVGGYEEIKKLIDGYIEIVRPAVGYIEGWLFNSNNVFICDEEGRCKDKPENIFGELLYNGLKTEVIPICGDIVIVSETTDREDFKGLTDDELVHYEQILDALEYKKVGGDNGSTCKA